ncbi:MAG: 3-phosphoshikimate 1-carboxyvinyltransferase [Flavobacterium sp. MedPE-SWcel]|uniref:3-phosphoshikimate 1-carboxyvinyltransferase n=1 Tax=uncultured Flavobacterium sp. TaxID=165435 RepID=UPI0009116804|nr:3-phosphoshikimate 1-carboxyvinyltransferase [uncultured Flavobacterium sp.]OIQ21309.1 MAG: 3-phosphoshikimate 1-carboxyvinyltransferase [Flavobacterium sp. MedPE-SWcel]
MDVGLKKINTILPVSLNLSGSKSETNRLLLLQAFFSDISIQNISSSDDSVVMQNALTTTDAVIDVHHAGTAMRFLTAYFSLQHNREIILTGSDRMKQRPISILVDALRSLGANIDYTEKEGFPPLKIKGKTILKNSVSIDANVSSQYITALMLIASNLKEGLQITLNGEITSLPYIKMTLSLLNQVGIEAVMNDNSIKVFPRNDNEKSISITVESDWSSVSYFYSIIALSPVGSAITLSSFKEDSLQGDIALVEIYKSFGVTTVFNGEEITLTKVELQKMLTTINLSLNSTPDIAQTIAVTCLGLGIECYLTGLHTLKIKETDRLEALKTELEKFGAVVMVTNDSLEMNTSAVNIGQSSDAVSIATYNDHRMAMAFAPLALKNSIIIEDSEVVSKSYPAFWNDLEKLGFILNKT